QRRTQPNTARTPSAQERWISWGDDSAKRSGDFPPFAAERIHQSHGPFDELARLVHFLDRLAAVGPRDHDTVVAGGTIARDLVPELLAVAIEEPNHRRRQNTTNAHRVKWRISSKEARRRSC